MRKWIHWAVPMALALCAGLAQAQEQPKLVPVFRASMASMDALTKLLTDLGIPTPGELKTNLETAPFLGPDTVATDKPFGVVILAGEGQPLFPVNKSAVMGIPLVAGKVTVADLIKAGGKPVEGQADTVSMVPLERGPTGTLRRTAGYLFFKDGINDTTGLSAVNDTTFAADYKTPGDIGMITVSMDALRKGAPAVYKDLAKHIAGFPMSMVMPELVGPADPAELALIQGIIDKVDRLTIALGRDDKNLHLKGWLSPTPLVAKSREMLRPAFPAGMVAQAHVIYPDAQAAGMGEQLVGLIPEEHFGLPPALSGRVKELLKRFAHLNSQCDAVSAAFGMKEGHVVVYLVAQFSKETEGLKEIKEIVEQGIQIASEAGEKITAEPTTYDAGGKPVQRLTLSHENSPTKMTVDGIQNGKVMYLTVSDSDAKQVGELAAAPMTEKSSVLCAGALDLGGLVKLFADMGELGMPPDKAEALKKNLNGQAITWTIQSSEQNYLYLDLGVSIQAVKELASRIFE